jgi:hypothetical protein
VNGIRECIFFGAEKGAVSNIKETNLDILPCTRCIWESMISKTLHMFKFQRKEMFSIRESDK